MGMYCCCDERKTEEGWKCKCDWRGWFLCFENRDVPDFVEIKEIPESDGIYQVRVFEDGDDYETESEFSLSKKNWGESTNRAISHWKITYNDNWTGYRGVYAWKSRE